MKKIITHSPEETMDMSERLARELKKGDIIALIGDLGAGKTVFVKGVAKGLEVPDHLYVNSPTFVLMKEYHGGKDLYHFDVYRVDLDSFCDTVDYRRYFYGDGIAVVEWADKIQEILPEEYLEVCIKYGKGQEREFSFRSVGKHFKTIISRL